MLTVLDQVRGMDLLSCFIMYTPFVGNELIPAVVLETEHVAAVVRRLAVVPDLLEGGGQVGGRAPSGLSLEGPVAALLLVVVRSFLYGQTLPDGSVKIGGGGLKGGRHGRRGECHQASSGRETHLGKN